MSRFILIVLSLIVVASLIVSCAGVMQVGPVRVAPAPQVSAFNNATPQVLSPQSDQPMHKGMSCQQAKKKWDSDTGGSTTLVLTDPKNVELKDLFHFLIVSCGYPYDVKKSSDGSGVTITTTVYEKGQKPKDPRIEEFMAHSASKGDIARAKEACAKLALWVNSGAYEQYWFIIKVGDSEAIQLQKKELFDALEALGGASCSKWFSVRIVGGVYVIYEK